jgi:RHS repeat-associated protein
MIAIGVAFALVATVCSQTLRPRSATAAPPPPPPPAEGQQMERPDPQAALITARMTGQRVKIPGLTSETSEYVALPSGQVEATIHAGVVRVRRGNDWVPVDLIMRRDPENGSVAPVADPFDLRVSGVKPGGEHELAGIGKGADRLLVGWSGALPEPTLAGNRATYVDALPGVDLVVEATREGMETFLIVKSRQAAAGLAAVTFPITGQNVASHVREEGGNTVLKDANGRAIANVPTPLMWDAAPVDVLGGPANPAAVASVVAPRAPGSAAKGGVELTLKPDRAWLADPARQYPITIDPQLNPVSVTFDTYVRSDLTSDTSGATDLQVGPLSSGPVARSFVHWNVAGLAGNTVSSATVRFWNFWSGTCSPRSWEIWSTGPASTATRWSNQPPWYDANPATPGGQPEASSTQTTGYDSTCADNWISISGTSFFNRAAQAHQSTAYMGIRATSETDVSNFKQLRSQHTSNAGQVPYAVVTYNAAATVSARATEPSTPCVIGSGRPFINTKTPKLKAQIIDPEAASVQARYEWWPTGGAAAIGSSIQGPGPSGSWLPAAVVPTGHFSEGGNYSWRVQGSDGLGWGLWSSWCEFTVDTVAPGTAPSVSSTTYPEGAWAGGAGTPGTFTLGAAGVSDVASYLYGLDVNPPTTSVAATSLGGDAAVSITPTTNLPHTLYVQSVDRAGNVSPVRSYQFAVGSGGVQLPRTGDLSAAKFALQAQGQAGATGVTYEWRRGDADAWTTIPTADVTVAAGGGAVTWPQATSGGGAFAKLNWDVAATLNNAEAGPDPRDGPLQVRASFTGSGGASEPVKVAFDLNRAWASTVTVGPGNVNLITGNFGLAQSDVDVSGMSLSRTFNTRQAAEMDPMFGPGWVSSAAAKVSFGYTGLTVTGSLVQIGLADGAVLGFTQKDAGNTTFDPQVGFESYRLTRSGTPAVYTLVEPNGNRIVFTQPAGAAAGVYAPSSLTPAGTSASSTVSWELVPGSTTEVRPTRVLAPVPSGVNCTTSLVRGCRAVTFSYATSTTATGMDEAQWGSFVNRLVKVDSVAYDPDLAPTPSMRTVEVARYAYDSTGHLRAAWDPRLDWTDSGVSPPVLRHLQRTYTYDGDGVLTAVTPPGQLPWQLAYTTVPADSGRGRLATVSTSTPTAGTAVSTVVYRVPVSGSGAPYDLSAAQTARWGQAEAPTDAAAVFPPTQIPDGNQAMGVLPSSFESATVTCMDANGRTVDTAAPGGGIDATWYDQYGNVTRTLTAGNRQRALDVSASDTPVQETILANARSTRHIFSEDGQRQWTKLEPEHDVMLPDGSMVRGRAKSSYSYDEGAPATGGPYRLVTTQVDADVYWTGGVEIKVDAKTTKTEYDWNQRKPTKVTVDPGGLDLVTRYAYDANGSLISTTTPAGGSVDTTPSTRRTVYYQAGTGSGYAQCDDRAEWANLPCRVQPGGQPSSGPELPVRATTYDMYGQPRTVTESTSAGVQRTVTTTYDAAGRAYEIGISTAAGLGEPVPAQRNVYDLATGQLVRTQAVTGGVVTAQVIRGYDTLGRQVSYTDADGNASTTTYDVADRPLTVNDGKGVRTYTYDGGSEPRGMPTSMSDSQTGSFTATYDVDGILVGQVWPNGVQVNMTIDETGVPLGIGYTQPGCGQADCTLYTETVQASAGGQWRARTSSLSSQAYEYDKGGRLTAVRDTVSGQCATRVYGFDTASNRTALTEYGPAEGGACQTATGAWSRTWTYDTADRVNTAGYGYDALGRTLTQPGADSAVTGGGVAQTTYHTNDMVRTISQNDRSATYTLDPVANRVRSWQETRAGVTLTKRHHYVDDGDVPAWTEEGDGKTTRPIHGLAGMAGIVTDPGGAAWVIVNLHGDVVGGMAATGFGLTHTGDHTEYGVPRNAADTGTKRYGWLGGSQRAADTPNGASLMGARLYSPSTGRFLSVDPVYGGSANAYDYTGGDPVNLTDVSGTAWCYRTGTWTAWYTIYRWYYFRCYLNHWIVSAIIKGFNWTAAYYAIRAALTGSAPYALASAIAWFIGAAFDWLYWVFCRRQHGVYINGYYVRRKLTGTLAWGGVRSVSCA